MAMNPMGPKNLYKHHQLNKSKFRDVMFTPQKSNIDTQKLPIKKNRAPVPFSKVPSFLGALQPSGFSGVNFKHHTHLPIEDADSHDSLLGCPRKLVNG